MHETINYYYNSCYFFISSPLHLPDVQQKQGRPLIKILIDTNYLATLLEIDNVPF